MHGFIGKFSLLCLAVSFLCGCSSVENAHRQKMDMMKAYEEGDNGATLEEIDYTLETLYNIVPVLRKYTRH